MAFEHKEWQWARGKFLEHFEGVWPRRSSNVTERGALGRCATFLSVEKKEGREETSEALWLRSASTGIVASCVSGCHWRKGEMMILRANRGQYTGVEEAKHRDGVKFDDLSSTVSLSSESLL